MMTSFCVSFDCTESAFESMSTAFSAHEAPSGMAVRGKLPHLFVADARAASANARCSEVDGSF